MSLWSANKMSKLLWPAKIGKRCFAVNSSVKSIKLDFFPPHLNLHYWKGEISNMHLLVGISQVNQS